MSQNLSSAAVVIGALRVNIKPNKIKMSSTGMGQSDNVNDMQSEITQKKT